MVVFYKIWKKYNEIQLTKKMDLNNLKTKNHPPSPEPNTTHIIHLLPLGRYNNNKHNMLVLYQRWKKYNIKFKNAMDFNNRKMKKISTLH